MTKNCLYCNEEFKVKTGKIYCCPDHQQKHAIQKAHVTIDKKKQELEDIIIKQYRDRIKSQPQLQKMIKFYDLIGFKETCDICGKSLTENLEDYYVPLHCKLKEGIDDYRVIDRDSWSVYCSKCFTEIGYIKENDTNSPGERVDGDKN